jgi:hypothetical protein
MPSGRSAATPGSSGSLVERLRAVHLGMVDAVLGGEGLGRVAELAAEAAGGAVHIIIPRLGITAVSGADGSVGRSGRPAPVRGRARPWPTGARARRRGGRGPDRLGRRDDRRRPAHGGDGPTRGIGVPAPGRDGLADRGGDRGRPRGGRAEPARLLPRGAALPPGGRARGDPAPRGTPGLRSLARGGRLCAELTTDRPRHVVATIAGEHPGALAQHMENRVYAILPA